MKKISVQRVGGSESQTALVDVVFIHGLHGDARKTWSSGLTQLTFWPLWIAQDDKLQVWSVDYPTLVTDWTGEHKLTIPQLANSIAHSLVQQGIGERPLVFVAHSMGGLLAKEMLAQGRFPNRASTTLRRACASVVFFGTPHWGAEVVSLLTAWAGGMVDFQKTHLYELRRDSQYLIALNTAFGYWLANDAPSCAEAIAYRETQPLLGQMVVPKDSADPSLGQAVQVVDLAGEDHVSMCKVTSQQDDRVRQLQILCAKLCSNVWAIVGKHTKLILSFHWQDAAAVAAARHVHTALQSLGIPATCDTSYQDRCVTPAQGWAAWRQSVLTPHCKVIVFCGVHYLAHAGGESPEDGDYCGLVLTPHEAQALQPGGLMPVLPPGEARHALPPWAKNFYNGMRLPEHLPQLIQALCNTGAAHRDLEDQ